MHFLLVPDRAAARRIRRALAGDGSRLGVMVGTWPELLGHAREAYLLPAGEEQWESRLEEAMAGIPDAFWSRSFQVARGETVSAVGRAYIDLVSVLEPGAALDLAAGTRLPRRAAQHLGDLSRLHAALDGRLPDEFVAVRELLAAPAAGAIRLLRAYWQDELPSLNRWQTAFIDKLNDDAGEPPDAALAACLEEICPGKLRGVSGSGLARLQADLYRADAAPAAPDDSVQWLGVRDNLEEAEVAAGMVQALLASDASLSPADVGLLLPDDADYVAAPAIDPVLRGHR